MSKSARYFLLISTEAVVAWTAIATMDAMLRDALGVRITCLVEILHIGEARYAWLQASPVLKVGLGHHAQNLDEHHSAIVYRKVDSLVLVLAIQRAFENHAIISGAFGIAKH